MKRSLFSPPDEFAALPLLGLLPVRGDTAELDRLTSSLYARYEKVHVMKKGFLERAGEDVPERVQAEAEMLQGVLEWLSVHLPG